MKTEVGLWIDQRRAVIVINLDQEETIKRITSHMEKRVRYSGASQVSGAGKSHNGTTENGRDRRFDDQLSSYYDKVIAHLLDATSILILGPGEAKGELQKRLEAHGLGERIAAVKTVDKMTDHQIAAKVWQHFRTSQHDSYRAT